MSNLNGFTLMAVGTLARNPELISKDGISFVRFCLIGNNHSMEDDGTERPVVSHVWFNAFHDTANLLLKEARKGDQLIVEALVCGSTVVQEYYAMQQVTFVVTAFEFGAKGRSSAEQATKENTNE